MPKAAHPRITLEFEPNADPIQGDIEHPDGSRHRFWGWLQLIEELRRFAGEQPETHRDRS